MLDFQICPAWAITDIAEMLCGNHDSALFFHCDLKNNNSIIA